MSRIKILLLTLSMYTAYYTCKYTLYVVLWSQPLSLGTLRYTTASCYYGELLLRLLRPWGTRLTTPFPPQTSNTLRFRCTATGCSASTCLYKNGCVRLYSTFIRQRLDQWQWFPSLVSILVSQKLDLPLSCFYNGLQVLQLEFQPQNKITLIKSSISARVGCS